MLIRKILSFWSDNRNKDKQLRLFFLTRVYFLAIFFALFSCKEKTEKLPPGILSKDKMIAILTDVHIAEASPYGYALGTQQVNGIMANRYDDIMTKYGITYGEFKNSFDYYLAHPQEMDEIYQEIINKLSALEGKSRAIKAPLKKLGTDSIAMSPEQKKLEK